ncbi:hypothetical protein EV424DRAFT_1335832, partial [Suillus variegatus]
VAIVQLYSPPDYVLLQLFFQTVKYISVIAMVPHTPTLPSGTTEDQFFMLEKPGLDISKLTMSIEEKEEDLKVEAYAE